MDISSIHKVYLKASPKLNQVVEIAGEDILHYLRCSVGSHIGRSSFYQWKHGRIIVNY